MSRRKIVLVSAALVVVVAAALVVWWRVADTVDATTADGDAATLNTGDFIVEFAKPRWTRELPAGAKAVADGAYAVVQERTGVRVYELATGTERWHHLDSERVVTGVSAGHDRLAVIAAHDIQLFDLNSGELLGTVAVSGGPRTVLPFLDTFLVLSDGRDAYRMYWNDGTELWSRKPKCGPGSGVVSGASDVVLRYTCGDKAVLEGIDPRAGGVRWTREVPNAVALTAGPPAAVEIPKEAPALVQTKDDQVVPVDVITGQARPARPVAPGAELTSVTDGWCAYEQTPAPVVRCADETTGAPLEQPYALPHEGNAAPEVWVSARWLRVAAATRVSLTVGAIGSRPTEVMSGADDPRVLMYAPGALVVVAGGELIVYS